MSSSCHLIFSIHFSNHCFGLTQKLRPAGSEAFHERLRSPRGRREGQEGDGCNDGFSPTIWDETKPESNMYSIDSNIGEFLGDCSWFVHQLFRAARQVVPWNWVGIIKIVEHVLRSPKLLKICLFLPEGRFRLFAGAKTSATVQYSEKLKRGKQV